MYFVCVTSLPISWVNSVKTSCLSAHDSLYSHLWVLCFAVTSQIFTLYWWSFSHTRNTTVVWIKREGIHAVTIHVSIHTLHERESLCKTMEDECLDPKPTGNNVQRCSSPLCLCALLSLYSAVSWLPPQGFISFLQHHTHSTLHQCNTKPRVPQR